MIGAVWQRVRVKRADLLIATTVLSGLLLTWLVLTGLDTFIQFANQIGNIGHNGYSLGKAIAYILLTVPRRAYQWFVFAALIGGLIGIGALATRALRPVETAIAALALIALSWGIFIFGLGLTMVDIPGLTPTKLKYFSWHK